MSTNLNEYEKELFSKFKEINFLVNEDKEFWEDVLNYAENKLISSRREIEVLSNREYRSKLQQACAHSE